MAHHRLVAQPHAITIGVALQSCSVYKYVTLIAETNFHLGHYKWWHEKLPPYGLFATSYMEARVLLGQFACEGSNSNGDQGIERVEEVLEVTSLKPRCVRNVTGVRLAGSISCTGMSGASRCA